MPKDKAGRNEDRPFREPEEEEDSEYDFHDALMQVEMLFQSHILSYGFKEYSIENFVDKKYFYAWKGKEGCSDTDAMRSGLNIDGILAKPQPSVHEILTYLQYALNIAELCRRNFNKDDTQGYKFDLKNYTELLSRIRELLTKLKYDVKYVSEKEFIYLVTKDIATDAVTDASDDPATDAIVEYNSYSVAGNLDRKRKILNSMGDTIESYKDNHNPGNLKLFSNIEFMLYNFNIRNDNSSGEDKVEYVASLSKKDLEAWYDETYQMMLLRILEHNNLIRMKRIESVQRTCEETSVENLARDIENEGLDKVISAKRVEDLDFVAKNIAEAAAAAGAAGAAGNSAKGAGNTVNEMAGTVGNYAGDASGTSGGYAGGSSGTSARYAGGSSGTSGSYAGDASGTSGNSTGNTGSSAWSAAGAAAEAFAGAAQGAVKKAEDKAVSGRILPGNNKEDVYAADAVIPAEAGKDASSRGGKADSSKLAAPSFRDVSDSASSAVSHTRDNAASFVKPLEDDDFSGMKASSYDDDDDDDDSAGEDGRTSFSGGKYEKNRFKGSGRNRLHGSAENRFAGTGENGSPKNGSIKNKSVVKTLLIILGIIIVLLLLGLGGAYFMARNFYAKANYVADSKITENTDSAAIAQQVESTGLTDSETTEIQAQVADQEAAAGVTLPDDKDVYNLLLVGVDRRDSSWYGNSDSMIVISINKTTKKITMLSLMRDLYADIPGHGVHKLNAACAYGGCPLLVRTIEDNYKIPIDNYAWVDFNGMIKIVDIIGGINGNISDEEMASANNYIKEMAELNGENPEQYYFIHSGEVSMNGYQAVGYARIRNVGNSDYGRTERQRIVLTQIINKVRARNIGEISQLAGKILPYITHNIPESTYMSLMTQSLAISKYEVISDRVPYDGLYTIKNEILIPDFAQTLPKIQEDLYGTSGSGTAVLSGITDTQSTSQSTGTSPLAAPTMPENSDSGSSSSSEAESQTTNEPAITPAPPWSWVNG